MPRGFSRFNIGLADITSELRQVRPDLTPEGCQRLAANLLHMAGVEGFRMRRDRLTEKISNLRAELKGMGLRGRYPKNLWAKLQILEDELVELDARH